LLWANERLVEALGWCSRFFAELPGAYPAVRVDAVQMLLLYLLLACVAAWVFWKWRAMRIAAPLVLLSLLGSWGWRARQLHLQQAVTVYAERDRLSLAVVEGARMTVLADSQDTYLERKVDLHARSVGVSTVTWSAIPADKVLLAGDSRLPVVVVAPGRLPARVAAGAAAVVLHGDGRFDLDALRSWLTGKWPLVLAADIPARRRAFVRSWCVENGIPCHDVDRDGAFILTP
jgi:hypothetical protein